MQNIFNRTNVTLALAGAFAAVSLATAVACDSSSGATSGTATPVQQPPTQIVEVHTTPDGTSVTNPTATPKPATSAPRVVWMAETHAGAGAITVDIETDTPTTATISLFGGQAGDPTQYPGPESDATLATHHTIAIGTGGSAGIVKAVVTDAQGRKTTADLGTPQRADAQFWALGTFSPKLAQQGLTATATWRTMNAPGATTAEGGAIVLLSKQAGCTTAQACLLGNATTLTNDTAQLTPDSVWDTHSLAMKFPDATHDYYVVLMEPRADGEVQFYQFDVSGASLKAG
jgi:hypothetical protein